MVTGMHVILYARDAAKARAFFKDVLGFASVDAGHGWLIFALPPAELAAHPADESDADDAATPNESVSDGQPRCELYFMCDDLRRTVEELKRKGVEFVDGVSEQGWGLLTTLKVPGAGPIGLYQPKHPTAIGMR